MTTSRRNNPEVDVAVVGLGAMGSMTLWRCAAAGLSAVGLEQYDIAHQRGSSHGRSRLFRVTCLEGAAYTRLAGHALPLWRELEQSSGRALLTRTGGVMIGPPDSNVVRSSITAAHEAGVSAPVLNADETRSRFPQFTVADDEVVVFDEQAGMLDPEASVAGAVDAARVLGASVRTGVEVSGIDADGDVVRVRVGDETVAARHVVLCAGPWTAALLGRRDLPLQVRREVMTWFAPRPGTEPDFGPDRFPIFVRALPDGPGAWGCGLDGRWVKAVRERSTSDGVEPDEIPMELTDGDGARSAAYVRDYLPGLDPTPVHRQTCLTTYTPDQDFVIGPLQALPGTTVLAGFSGHGFKHAPAIGQLAAELAGGRAPSVDLSPFDPARLGL